MFVVFLTKALMTNWSEGCVSTKPAWIRVLTSTSIISLVQQSIIQDFIFFVCCFLQKYISYHLSRGKEKTRFPLEGSFVTAP
jgi:hypothetical protein